MVKTRKFFSIVAAIMVFAVLYNIYMPVRNFALANSPPHGISVVFHGDPYTQRGLTWVTDRRVGDSRVEYIQKTEGLTKDNINWNSPDVRTQPGTLSANGIALRAAHNAFKALVTGLTPGETYFYRITAASGALSSYVGEIRMRTHEDVVSNLTFMSTADPQQNTAWGFDQVAKVLRAGMQIAPDTDFVTVAGDLIAHSSAIDNIPSWNYYFDRTRDITMNIPMMASPGNHDRFDFYFSDRFHYDFANPHNHSAAVNLMTGGFHSFEYGNAFFAFLDTNFAYNNLHTTDIFINTQMQWLREELQRTTAAWRFVTLHEAAVSAQNWLDGRMHIIRRELIPMMARYNIDMVFQGHNHNYVRTRPFEWGEVTDVDSVPPVAGKEVITEFFNGYQIEYLVDPDGTVYVQHNSSGTSVGRWLSPYGPDVLPITLERIFPAVNPVESARLGKEVLAISRPQYPMFATITINNNRLTKRVYRVVRTTGNPVGVPILYDTFGVIKNLEHLAAESLISRLPANDGNFGSREDIALLAEAKRAFDELSDLGASRINPTLRTKFDGLMVRFPNVVYIAAINNAEDRIADIGMVDLTPESVERIDAARLAFEALPSAHRFMVTNLNVLEEAEQMLLNLPRVQPVIDLIATLDPGSDGFGDALRAARTAFNALTPAQRNLVDNSARLTQLEQLYQQNNNNNNNNNQDGGGCGGGNIAAGMFALLILAGGTVVFVSKKIR